MRYFCRSLVLIAVAAFFLSSVVEAKPSLDFTLRNTSGLMVSSTSFKGKIVVLNFWATWCPPCVGEIPYLVALQKKYEKQGVQVVGIAVDEDISGVPAFIKKHQMTYPILYSTPAVQKAFGGIRSIPTTFILDRNFKVLETLVGYHDLEGFEKVLKKHLKK